jgi:hypothetical protein
MLSVVRCGPTQSQNVAGPPKGWAGLGTAHNGQRTHFLSTSSRNVGPRKIQFVGVSEIGPLMPKIAI